MADEPDLPPRPARFYHYQRFNPDHLASLLVDRKIRFSRPDSFNDPWDCRPNVAIPETAAERRRARKWFQRSHQKHFPDVPRNRRRELVRRIHGREAEMVETINRTDGLYATMCQQYRLYCVSEVPDSLLMWAHYGGSHTGTCVEFDASSFPFPAALKVEYRDAFPTSRLEQRDLSIFVTKSDQWAYEREYRVVAEDAAYPHGGSQGIVITRNDFLVLPEGAIRSIIIGCRVDPHTEATIREIAARAHSPILVRKAILVPNRYALSFDPPLD
jgi:hypothetical protein